MEQASKQTGSSEAGRQASKQHTYTHTQMYTYSHRASMQLCFTLTDHCTPVRVSARRCSAFRVHGFVACGHGVALFDTPDHQAMSEAIETFLLIGASMEAPALQQQPSMDVYMAWR